MIQKRKRLTKGNFQNLSLGGTNNKYLAKNNILNSILVSVFVFVFLIFMKLGTNLYGETVAENFEVDDLKYNLYEKNGVCTATLAGFSDGAIDKTTVVVPASVEYNSETYEVREVVKDAFSFCRVLESVDLSRCVNLAIIGEGMFCGCTALKNVDLRECLNLKNIGNEAFFGCRVLKSLKIPGSIDSIGRDVCVGCGSLSEIEIGENDKYIVVDNVVYELDSVNKTAELIIFPAGHRTEGEVTESFTVPGIVEKDSEEYTVIGVGYNAFRNCVNLENLDFSMCFGLKYIGDEALWCCRNLKSVNFSGCGSLRVGDYAFDFCQSLEFIIFNKAPIVGLGAFKGEKPYTYHKVIFKDSAGNVGMVQYVFTETDFVKDGYAQKPTDPTRAGYECIDWYGEGTKFDFDTKITGDKTLTAKIQIMN